MSMNIVLDYNPYTVQTKVYINGKEESGNFSPFIRVNRYPIQTWLKRRMDWPGLPEQLKTLSRGGDICFKFIGRSADFEDVRAELESSLDQIRVMHELKYNQANLLEMDTVLAEIHSVFLNFPQRRGNGIDKKIREFCDKWEGKAWEKEAVVTVQSEEDYLINDKVIEKSHQPLFITEKMYRQFGMDIEKKMKKSFYRPYDSIYILLDDWQDAKFYDDQRKVGICVDVYREEIAERICRKYAVAANPAGAEWKIELCKWIGILEKEWDHVDSELKLMRYRSLHQTETDENEEERYDQYLKWKKWYDKNSSLFLRLKRSIEE